MWLAKDKQAEAARARRLLYPIHFYEGKNGSAKSCTMVYDTLPELDEGLLTLSTVRLLDFRNPRPCDDPECNDLMHGRADHMAAHPCFVPFTRWSQLLEWGGDPEDTDTLHAFIRKYLGHSELAAQRALHSATRFGAVLMDEITGVADSNADGEIPGAVRNKLPQLRRDDIPLRMTGLKFIRASKRIRESVGAVTACKTTLPVPRKDDEGNQRLYRPRRLAKAVTYDAMTLPLDDLTMAAFEKADVICKGRLWIPDSLAINAYDTYAPVLTVGTVTDAGRCARCSGTRRAPECQCPDYQASRPQRRTAGAQGARAEHRRSARDGHRDNGHVHYGELVDR